MPNISELCSQFAQILGGKHREGRALNLGETALLEAEVPAFTWHLQRSGIVVSAIHNRWLKESPRLIYVHYESIEDPLAFARKAAEAFSILR
ncbi:MAG TPA: DUF1259 domain-containing protein [Symbiobacteriaceae bacterium]|jgi:hypothetical protein|nr:DUF1259 domain-containing protein [Symbiobacteriaceae bacterium]